MRSRMTLLLGFCISWSCLVTQASGGAWVQEKGAYYFKIATGYMNSTSDIDAKGNQVPKAGMGKLRDLNYSAYMEYGIHERITVVTSAPYKRLIDNRTFASGITKEKRNGFGDLETRLRWLVKDGPLVMSFAVGGKFPLWYTDAQEATRVPLSTKKVDADARLLLGKSLYPFPGYVTGEMGFRMRGGALSNEMFYGLEAGVNADRFLFKGFISGIRTFGTCEPTGEVQLIGDQNVLKLSPGVVFSVTDRVDLSAEIIHVFSGCNTGAGNTFFLGVAFKR